MADTLADVAEQAEYDVVVIGAGAAGMEAALVAAIDGARVLLVERTEYVGGTGALSGGANWIPNSPHAASVNKDDTPARAQRYLDLAVGTRSDSSLRATYLREGGRAVAYLEQHSEVKFRARAFNPDYFSELEGSTVCGRPIEPVPFDGRKLGADFALVRPPIPEFTVLGGMMVDRDDMLNLLTMTRSFKAFRHCVRIIGRQVLDRARGYPRGTRLVMGNALIARLLYSLRKRGVSILVNTELKGIHRGLSGVEGITLEQGATRRSVRVKGGVILATGGFNRHPQRRAEMLHGTDPDWCVMAPGNTGVAQDLALGLGAKYGQGAATNGVWVPVSVRKRADGGHAVFPHFFLDRGKPGMIVVNREGKRFVNESASYQVFGITMLAEHERSPSIPAYLITDAAGLRRYGMGMVRPGGRGLRPFLNDGYLTEADTLAELASKLGIESRGLHESVRRINAYAATGVDPDFHRGETTFERANGDATWPGKNPSLGPIQEAPFYAVRLYPGDIGASTGLAADEHARVLDGADQPIPGLYACGTEMHSIMGGTYPGGGITLGPGLVFGYLAARHAAARSR